VWDKPRAPTLSSPLPAPVRTGNAALDTILSEKRLVCEGEDIELSVMADGSALDELLVC